MLSPHPSSAAAEAAAAAAAEAAAGGRDPAALERKLSLARWRSGGVGGKVAVAVVASSSSSSAAAAVSAAAGSSVPFEDEKIEALEQALAEASAAVRRNKKGGDREEAREISVNASARERP